MNLDNSNELLPIIDRLESEGRLADLFVLPAVLGVFCLLPGLFLGLVLPQKFVIALMILIVVFCIIAALLFSRADKIYRKKYISFANEKGVSQADAEDFFEFWKGLKGKAQRRLMKNYKEKAK